MLGWFPIHTFLNRYYVWGRFQCPSCFFVVLCPNWGRLVFTAEKQDLLPPTKKFEEKLSFLSFRDYLFDNSEFS